jgi:hypothetical protein
MISSANDLDWSVPFSLLNPTEMKSWIRFAIISLSNNTSPIRLSAATRRCSFRFQAIVFTMHSILLSCKISRMCRNNLKFVVLYIQAR